MPADTLNNTMIADTALQIKDAGAITADAAAQVGGSNKILDLGTGRVRGEAVIDVTALDVASNDELYNILIQGSNSSSFASGVVNLGQRALGAAAALPGGVGVSAVGRYRIPFDNDLLGTKYRYVRAYTDVGGTTPSINYSGYLDIQRI